MPIIYSDDWTYIESRVSIPNEDAPPMTEVELISAMHESKSVLYLLPSQVEALHNHLASALNLINLVK